MEEKQQLTKRAILIKLEDWEALFIDKIIYNQDHEINEGKDRGIFFLEIAETFDLKKDDFQIVQANDEMYHFANDFGELPEEFDSILEMWNNE